MHAVSFRAIAVLAAFVTPLHSRAQERDWEQNILIRISPELRDLQDRETVAKGELDKLGTPTVGQTVAEFGYQSRRLSAPPVTPLWVQVDLLRRQNLDWIALVPAQLDWQPIERPAYGFPRRFRIDVSEDADFQDFKTVADYTDADFEDPGIAPVSARLHGVSARFIRITVTKLAVENGQYFFALAELMVLGGNRDIAIGCPVRVSSDFNLEPRWSAANLVDGWTPLGPPIRRELLPYDGLYADAGPNREFPWMIVDLGKEFPIQEVRLHPVHARIGADVPGFSFPRLFRIEGGRDEGFSKPDLLFDTGATEFPNPGSNPVTIPVHGVTARYIRFQSSKEMRVGLSEMEIYSDGRNMARGTRVLTSGDKSAFSHNWPPSLLVDGYTSYGRLMEWPEWLGAWSRRSAVRRELAGTTVRRVFAEAEARRRLTWVGASLIAVVAVAAGGVSLAARRRRKRELTAMRTALARDLHDEIGSNLAALAVLSEYALDADEARANSREDWSEVNRIARESTDSMREVLWLMGARAESGIDLANHLELVANRMLNGIEVHWKERVNEVPSSLSMEAKRQVFLFFKEALANVVRHSGTEKVELSTAVRNGSLQLTVRDFGRGFAVETMRPGVGLKSLHERARVIGGVALVESTEGKGTRVSLAVPLA